MNSFFQQRPFILGIFFLRKTWQSGHKSSYKIILFATRTRPHIILLKIHPKKNHNKLKKISTKSNRERNWTRIRRVTIAPQSKHLPRFSAIVLPQVKHNVICLQLLPYKSVVLPQPLHDGCNWRSNDISLTNPLKKLGFSTSFLKKQTEKWKLIESLGLF